MPCENDSFSLLDKPLFCVDVVVTSAVVVTKFGFEFVVDYY